jgi:hypothetical protein
MDGFISRMGSKCSTTYDNRAHKKYESKVINDGQLQREKHGASYIFLEMIKQRQKRDDDEDRGPANAIKECRILFVAGLSCQLGNV